MEKDLSTAQGFQALLAFYSRQSIRVNIEQWTLTVELLQSQGLLPTGSEFYLKAPFWSELKEISGIEWQKQLDEIRRYQERGIGFYLPLTTRDPYRFDQMSDPPRCLTYYGNLDSSAQWPRISIVGSRQAAPDLLSWLDQVLSKVLKLEALAIVSGGARGVDQQAHFSAIRANRPTWVLLPSGLLNPYPLEIQKIIPQVLESGGVLMSEYHPMQPMRKWYFHQRNRLIAGLSPLLWLPQARIRSGSWMTAKLAADLGVTVATNTAPPWEEAFSGNLKLLEEGAQCIYTYQDLLNYCASHHLRVEAYSKLTPYQ